MPEQSDLTPVTTTEPIARSSEAELAVLHARVAQLEQDAVNQKWLDDAIKSLTLDTASATGHEFLQVLVQQLATTFMVPYVFVTEWIPGQEDRLRTVAGWCDDHVADSMEYEVSHTPCQKVFQDGEAFFPRDVQQLFPQDKYLTEFNIESYMGVSLPNRDGQPTGHLCIMDVRPFLFDRPQSFAILRVFAAHAAVELERFRAEKTLSRNEEAIRSLLQVTSEPGLTVEQRLQAVLELGCRRFSLPIGAITQVRGDELVLTHVHAPDTNIASGMRLELCKTYCNTALHMEDPLCFEHAGASDWRTHPGYTTFGFECYFGTKLTGRPRTHGTIGFLGREPYHRQFTKADKEFLQLMGRWVGTELDRRDSEHTLRASEARLYRFVSDAPVGLVILDKEKRLISANKAFCELTGYAEHEVLGQTYERFTHPDDRPAHLILMNKVLRGMRPKRPYEKRCICKSGEIIWVSVNARPLELPGHTGQLFLAAIQDITEQKLAMAERQQLSHDLHDNLLQLLYATGIQINAGMRTMGMSNRQSKTHMRYAIQHLEQLMSDVRQYIAVLNDQHPNKPDLKRTLKQLVVSWSHAGQAPPKLEIEDSVLPLITVPQREQLLNIVREALSNSMRHGQATHRSVQLTHTTSRIRLTIRDDGIGFAPKRLRHRGYGLANMAARAKDIHARLSIHSAPGKGTCVTVVVPKENRVVDA